MTDVRMTDLAHNNQLLYFTSTSLASGDDALVYISDRTGHPNIFCRYHGRDEKQLTFNEEGTLKSYVYFWGTPGKGIGKASISLHAGSGIIYYIQGTDVCCVDMKGNRKVLARLPEDQVTAFTHVSRDGKLLCVPTTDARALEYDTPQDTGRGAPDYDIDRRVQEERLNSFLRVFDTGTGREIFTECVPRAWITHVQFSPTDNSRILYNHEWPADCGVRRMWLWDGKEHIRLRHEGDGRTRADWTCHEMWQRNGEDIIYHGTYENGLAYIGKVRADGTGLIEIPLRKEYSKYGHFTVSRHGLLVTDGYYQAPDDSLDSPAQWISVLRVDWKNKRIEWTPLCRHGSDWDSQDSHPHPIFNHGDTAVYFTSNREGVRAVYRIPFPG